jgi:uncharacterized protein YjcR
MTTPAPLCGGLTRAGNPCTQWPGWGTDHVGHGKCKLHGGKSPGAPKGNKNALVTGEHEELYYSALQPEEQNLYDRIEPTPYEECIREMKLTSIRIHRVLIKIRRQEESSEDGLGVSSITTHDGWNVKGKVDFTVEERNTTLDTIMRLEEALTRLQSLKAKFIDQLRGILKENPPSSGGLDAIVDAIDRSAKEIAAQKERERELEAATGGVLD